MLAATKDVVDRGGMDAGRLGVPCGLGEGPRKPTPRPATAPAGEIDAAVVGEPTNLGFAIAQRGLLMVDVLAQGEQRHAGNTDGDGDFSNSALVLAQDLLKLPTLFRGRVHPLLGSAVATPTMLEAG